MIGSGNSIAREVLLWLQSLDLSKQIRYPKWDFSNGYLIAEILSFYFPSEILMHNYHNCESADLKTRNWSLIELFIRRKGFALSKHVIDGTKYSRDDASVLLIEQLFEILTNRKVKKKAKFEEVTLTDENYQLQLPLHARSTASRHVHNNIKHNELIEEASVIKSQQKAQSLIERHVTQRALQRATFPDRFVVRESIGEQCIRIAPNEREISVTTQQSSSSPPPAAVASNFGPPQSRNTFHSNLTFTDGAGDNMTAGGGAGRAPSVHFKEIGVRQHVQPAAATTSQ